MKINWFVIHNKDHLGPFSEEVLVHLFEAGDIDSSKYARIVAGFNQGEEIPIELNLGTISQEDKLKANPNFAEYIAYDTEKTGIPTLIKNQARKYLK